MPTQYVTIKQNEPRFSDYLWGRNLVGQRAIPVKTYNLGTSDELVTFELKNISEIKNPGVFVYFASLIKLKSFILILFPLFYVLVKNYIQSEISDPLGIGVAAISSILLFAALNIRNDVYDHISGFDRVNLDLHNKPIRMGWISAHQSSRLSWILIFVSGLLAFPVALLHPKLIGIIAATLALFFFGRFFKNNFYKQNYLGGIILFLLIGPALVTGYQVAAGAVVDTEIISFGALWGYAVLYLIQVNNFSHIMTSSQSGIRNTMTKLGFDLSQKFLIIFWIFFIAFWILFNFYFADVYWTAFSSGLLILRSLPLFIKIANIKSPMGSGLQGVRKEAYKVFLIMVLIFLIKKLSQLWVM